MNHTLLLYEVKRFDRTVHENWAQLLLPYLGRADVAAIFDRTQPVMAEANKVARLTPLARFTCPTDALNAADNLYGFQPCDDRPPLAEFARGNYAINGGSHSIKYPPQSTTQPHGETMHMVLDHERRRFEAIGSGIAGINHSFRCPQFANGQSTLVAVFEVRAGDCHKNLADTFADAPCGPVWHESSCMPPLNPESRVPTPAPYGPAWSGPCSQPFFRVCWILSEI